MFHPMCVQISAYFSPKNAYSDGGLGVVAAGNLIHWFTRAIEMGGFPGQGRKDQNCRIHVACQRDKTIDLPQPKDHLGRGLVIILFLVCHTGQAVGGRLGGRPGIW